MSFDTIQIKKGLLEAAARYHIIRDQSINENLELALLAILIIESLTQITKIQYQTNFMSQKLIYSSLPATRCLKDEPFTRELSLK